MPDISENLEMWTAYHWREHGDEWSHPWGGASSQWRASILPRIRPFLPARVLVEIGPGHGRWTQLLRRHCECLIGVDLSPGCVAACRYRFADDERLSFNLTDGKTLTGVEDGQADLVFSFDTLVHAEQDVMDAYLVELARVLSQQGVAFLHHSNAGSCHAEEIDTSHWRARSVSAETVAASASDLALSGFRQELVTWGTRRDHLLDCFTWIARVGSQHDRGREVARNFAFMDEADRALARATRWRRTAQTPRRLAASMMRRLPGSVGSVVTSHPQERVLHKDLESAGRAGNDATPGLIERWQYALVAVAGIALFPIVALLVEAVTDRDWRLSGMEWPGDFITAVLLVGVVPGLLAIARAGLGWARHRHARPPRTDQR